MKMANGMMRNGRKDKSMVLESLKSMWRKKKESGFKGKE